MLWRTAFLWQTSVELRAGWHRTPLQDSTVSALRQFLPACWVTGNGREELAYVMLAAPFPLIWGCERLFPPPIPFPGRRILVEFLLHPWLSEREEDARPNTVVSSPGSPVSHCTALGPYQCLNMLPPFGQDVASIAPFSGRPASPSLLPSCNNK